jgi:hypothetical protein
MEAARSAAAGRTFRESWHLRRWPGVWAGCCGASTCDLHAFCMLFAFAAGIVNVRGRFRPGHASSRKEEAMITVEFTEAEAQAVADVIVAWGADDCPVGMIDTRALYTAQGKLGAVIDSQIVKAA